MNISKFFFGKSCSRSIFVQGEIKTIAGREKNNNKLKTKGEESVLADITGRRGQEFRGKPERLRFPAGGGDRVDSGQSHF